MTYKYYTWAGETRDIVSKKPLSLKELQSFVGGFVEFINWEDKLICINEEGRLSNLPTNAFFPMLVGNVLIGKKEGEEFVGL